MDLYFLIVVPDIISFPGHRQVDTEMEILETVCVDDAWFTRPQADGMLHLLACFEVLHGIVLVCLPSKRYVSPLFSSVCHPSGDNDSENMINVF